MEVKNKVETKNTQKLLLYRACTIYLQCWFNQNDYSCSFIFFELSKMGTILNTKTPVRNKKSLNSLQI